MRLVERGGILQLIFRGFFFAVVKVWTVGLERFLGLEAGAFILTGQFSGGFSDWRG